MLIKKMIIKKARVTVMMCGNEKFSRLMPYTFASMEDVDYIISDKPLPDEYHRATKKMNIKML